jgi:hypothetical protein
MSSNAALEQRKIPSRDRRQQKRSGGAADKAKKTVSKAAANSAANSAAKPFTSYLSTPPPRSQHRGGQDASHLLNFRAPERRQDLGSRPLPHRRRGPVVHFDKDRYFGANYRFVVAREQGEDYAAHLAFADKAVDWPLIREVHVSEEGSYNCPICLEPPIAARLTQVRVCFVLHVFGGVCAGACRCVVCMRAGAMTWIAGWNSADTYTAGRASSACCM